MSLHCLFVPALRHEPAQTELNTVLAHCRVLTLARAFVTHGVDSGGAFCVALADGPALSRAARRHGHVA